MFEIFEIPLYYSNLVVGIGNTQEEATALLNEKFKGLDLEIIEGAGAVTYDRLWKSPKHKKKFQHYVIVVFGIDTTDINTIAHETVHVVNNIFEHVGAKLDTQNDEAQAYLTGWVAENIGKVALKYDKKHKIKR